MTGVFCWEDGLAEGEADTVVEEFVSALEPHSPDDVWHSTPQYDEFPSVLIAQAADDVLVLFGLC